MNVFYSTFYVIELNLIAIATFGKDTNSLLAICEDVEGLALIEIQEVPFV